MTRTLSWIKKHSEFISVAVGILLAFLLTVIILPSEIWSLPIQTYDTPAHLNYIQRILDEGPAVAINLKFEGGFYPPLFHLLAASLAVLFRLSVPAAATAAWLVASGIIFPLGMLFFVKEFFRYKQIKLNFNPLVLNLFLPALSLTFAVFPHKFLEIGTLYAYGIGVAFLPFLLACSLRFFRKTSWQNGSIVALAFVLTALAQPRALFLWVIIIAPFVILEMKKWGKKAIFSVVALAMLGVGVVLFYVLSRLKSSLLFDPKNWFATLDVELPAWQGIIEFFSATSWQDPLNILLGIVIILTLILANTYRKDIKVNTLLISFFAIAIIYVIAILPPTGLGNIITAAWYRNPWRIIAAFPIVFLPIFIAVINRLWVSIVGKITAISLVALLVLSSQVFVVRQNIIDLTDIYSSQTSMLTDEKILAFDKMKDEIGDGILLADPFSGATLSYALDDIDLLLPTPNPRIENSSKVQLALEAVSTENYTKLCQINSEVYVAYLGPPFTTFDPIYHQYDNLQNLNKTGLKLIAKYESGQEKPFALYKISCQ